MPWLFLFILIFASVARAMACEPSAEAEVILEQAQLQQLTWEISECEIQDQVRAFSDPTAEPFSAVFLQALETILRDDSWAFTPLSMTTRLLEDNLGRNGMPYEILRELALTFLHQMLNHPSSTLRLRKRNETTWGPPIIHRNWLFHLMIRDYKTHEFFVVVDRYLARPPFIVSTLKPSSGHP